LTEVAFDDLFDDLPDVPEGVISQRPVAVKGQKTGNRRHYRKANLDFSVIQAVQTNGQCKICQHPERHEIDKMIYRHRMRDITDDGTPFTLDYLVGYLAEIGVPSPNKTNIQGHWNKHCEIPNRAAVVAKKKSVGQLLDAIGPKEILEMSRPELLDLMMRQGVLEAGARLETTGKSGITVSDVLKIAELQIREKGSEAQNEFLKALGGGIVAAVKNGIPAKQIANAEVIEDAEIVDEAESVDVAA
jgi:hypothetical protein